MPEYALLQDNCNVIRNKRKVKRNELIPIPHRWFEVVSLHLAGKSTKEISEITGYSVGTLYGILKNERTQAVRQQLLSVYQDEFEALFEKVIGNIRTQLDAKDTKTQQVAQQQWLNAEKKFKIVRGGNGDGETAEDLVAKLLNVNVQVNVAQNAEVDGGS